MLETNCKSFKIFQVVSDLNTRAYEDTKDNLGPCDVCKLSLSLVPADAKVMTSTGWYFFILTQTAHHVIEGVFLRVNFFYPFVAKLVCFFVNIC